jgi:hypothetical protein
MLTKEQLECMNEMDLIDNVLLRLFAAMGYHDVTKYHGGVGEKGKDIVCWKTDELGSRINLALVVKAVPITGKAGVLTGTAGEVSTQIQQCFGRPFIDPISGDTCPVHRCWVISNQRILKEGEDAINAALSTGTLGRNVSFVNGDKLWELIEQHLPEEAVWQKLHEATEVFGGMDSHYAPRVEISKDGIQVTVDEKFPGALQEKPFVIKPTFVFTQTEEGRAAKAALEHSFATGAPVDIPPQFIQTIEFPEFFRKIFPQGIPSLHIKPVPIGQFLARIEVQCDDGDTFTMEYIHFRIVQGGAEEITLVNEDQPVPIRANLVVNLREQKANLSFTFRGWPWNASQVYQVLRFQTCMSKPSQVTMIHIDTGISAFEMKQAVGVGEAPDQRFVRAVAALAEIQKRLKKVIVFPVRPLTADELQSIERLRKILHTGRTRLASLKFPALPGGVEHVLNQFGDGRTGLIRAEAEIGETLFGTDLPLGKIRIRSPRVVLSNETEVRERFNSHMDEQSLVDCIFSPAPGAELIVDYLDWQVKEPEIKTKKRKRRR